jgi:hypothetical protein
MGAYTPRTGARCSCRRGVQRDNCPACEGTGWVIDFAAIHRRRRAREAGLCLCGEPLGPDGRCSIPDCVCQPGVQR